jgi:hypothetical protein
MDPLLAQAHGAAQWVLDRADGTLDLPYVKRVARLLAQALNVHRSASSKSVSSNGLGYPFWDTCRTMTQSLVSLGLTEAD